MESQQSDIKEYMSNPRVSMISAGFVNQLDCRSRCYFDLHESSLAGFGRCGSARAETCCLWQRRVPSSTIEDTRISGEVGAMALRLMRAARIVQVYTCLLLILVQALPGPCSARVPVPTQEKERQAPVMVIPAIYPLDTSSVRDSVAFDDYSLDMVWDALVNHPYFRDAPRHSFKPIKASPLSRVQRQEEHAVSPETKRNVLHISTFAKPQNSSQQMQSSDPFRISIKSNDGKHVSIVSSKTDVQSELRLRTDSKKEPLVVRRLYPVWEQQSVSDMPVPGIVLVFSKSMVAPSEVGHNTNINASVAPPSSGSWRWLDSKTLMFDPEAGQLAFGTAFEIKVPKGTKALDGTALEQGFSSKFSTCLSTPEIDFTTSPEFSALLLFKAPIKVESLESRIEATIEDKPVSMGMAPSEVQGRPLKLRLASGEQARRLLGDRYKKEQTFAFVPETQPPDGARVSLNLREGVEALSGSQTMNSLTTGFLLRSKQLLIRGADTERVYEPGEPLEVVLSQMIADNNNSDRVSVSPPIENLQLGFSNSRLYLKGDTVPGTNYTITLKRGFRSKDSELEFDQSVVCHVGSYKPRLIPPAHPYALIDSSKHAYSISSVNVNRLRVRVYKEDEDQTNEESFLWKRQNLLQERRPTAAPLLDITMEPHGVKDRITETPVDLSKLIRSGRHQMYICVDQIETSNAESSPSGEPGALKPIKSFSVMLQVSDLRVTCFPLEDKLAFWVIDGKTGAPVRGARVSRYQRWKQTILPTSPPAWTAHYKKANDSQDVIALTNADGVAWLPGAAAESGGSPFLVKTANDAVVVFGEAAPLLLGLVRAQLDKEMVVADRRGSDAYIKFELPFESSIGVLACKSDTRFALIPLKFDSKVARIAVPRYRSDDLAMHFVLKVYDTEIGSKPVSPTSRRSAMVGLTYDPRLNDRPAANHYAELLRRSAAPAHAEFEIQPETIKRLNNMSKGEYSEVRFAWPTSVDGLAALNDSKIDLNFQVGELHARYSSSHSGVRRSTYFPIPMRETSAPKKVQEPNAEESSLPLAVSKSEAFVAIPKSVVEGDTFNLCIQIRNAKSTTSAFEISIKSKDDSETFQSKIVDIEPGVTDVFIDNFEALVAQLKGQGATLHVREVSGTTSLDLEFDTTMLKRYKETTKFLTGVSGSAVNRGMLVDRSNESLKGKLQLSNYFAPIIEELEYRFEEMPMLSSNLRAARLLAFLERRRLHKSPHLEQIINEDVRLFEDVSRQGFEWKSWLPTGEHQNVHGSMYQWSPYLMVEALLAAQEAGIDFDKSGMNSFLFKGPFVFLKGQEDIPRELYQLQSFACYQSTRGLKEFHKADSASLKHDQQRYAKDLDEWFASHDLSTMDGEELAWTVMTCRLLPVSTANKNALESRLWAVASRSPEADAANKTVPPRTARTPDEQLRYEPIEPITDDTTAVAALLLAVLDENAPQDIHDNPEIVVKLTKKLEKNFYETGWTNLAKAGFCLKSLYKSEKILSKLASSGRLASASKGAEKVNLEPVSFNAGAPESREYSVELTSNQPIRLDLSGEVFFNLRTKFVNRSAELAVESELFSLRRMLLPADSSSSVWRTADGIWHCKKDSKVIMRLFLLPKCEVDWLATMVPFPAGFQPIPPKEEITYDAVPVWETDPGVREIYNRVPQKIIEKDQQLELYSRKLIPLLYRFEYNFKAANTGKFHLPPVEIKKVFDSRDFARTGCDTVVIEE